MNVDGVCTRLWVRVAQSIMESEDNFRYCQDVFLLFTTACDHRAGPQVSSESPVWEPISL